MSGTFKVAWKEDGDATVLGRITARNGSGAATGVNGEGNWLEQADISSIVQNVFNLDADDPTAVVDTSNLTVSSVVLDTPVTTNVIWTLDTVGYNFITDVDASLFPTADQRIRIEFVVTLTGGSVFTGRYEGQVDSIYSS